ncbi:exo-rhamnogalacturonan lyase family protein [Saccharothrix deserti]|uniref:exo-rhamnogalacturonan lyase family protein n=1 Tax=Saccharothrix deserti TaxID=2593674 RepID=UPI00131D8A79|nr:Tat pathway signal sequence domain protein [Saccharothrix deserti]
MAQVNRRTFLGGVAAAGAAYGLPFGVGSAHAAAADPPRQAALGWLEGGAPATHAGTTWGVPWPRGAFPRDQTFSLTTASGEQVPVQTWTTGVWPDGSLKWSAHAISGPTAADGYRLEPGPAQAPAQAIKVDDKHGHVVVDTGVIEVTVRKSGAELIERIVRNGQPVVQRGHLVALRQDHDEDEDTGSARREKFVSAVRNVIVEQSGPVRAVLRIDGVHRGVTRRREWLPFTVRFYFFAGTDSIRMTHTFVWDGTADDYLRGLGIRFEVPMRDELYDRHIRFGGEEGGLLREAVRGITGLRRDPGAAVRAAQVAGRKLPPTSTWDTRVSSRLNLIPAWGDYSLSQLTADGFAIRKRTKPGHTWVDVDAGRRSPGFGYVGGASGGLAFGLRNFWQLHPTQLDVRGAAGDKAEVTVWLWSPDARPMDLRFYHDGLGMDTFPEQLEGLQITYEDYEPGFGTAYGVARTSELTLWALGSTPDDASLSAMSQAVQTPPLLVAPPQHLLDAGVFGDWSLVDRSTPARAAIEDRLDFLFDYHRDQVEQRRWYGFWNYGDVMHTYDTDRHQWRYDVGGYAWDNSELSTDLWLWYAYLRSGRADVFRMAEAMTRHTGEVDVYHLGQWKDLGTRHNVLHWGCSAKQLRISTAANRRFYYFLTADERVGDLLRELVDADRTFVALDPLRKIRTEPYTPDPKALAVGLGTDWGALAAAWLTEWERGGDPVARQKLLGTVEDIGALKNGFITGEALYNLETGRFATDRVQVSVSHLSAVFGLAEVCSELIDLVGQPAFERAWLQYCRLYGATRAEQQAEVGGSWNIGFRQMHSRLTAYAAARTGDAALAERAWNEFFAGQDGYGPGLPWRSTRVEGPNALRPVDEAAFVSTNASAQYGLAAIQTLALVGDKLPPQRVDR